MDQNTETHVKTIRLYGAIPPDILLYPNGTCLLLVRRGGIREATGIRRAVARTGLRGPDQGRFQRAGGLERTGKKVT